MDLLIKNTTKEQRKEIVKTAFALCMTNEGKPTKETANIIQEYINGISEIEEVQKKIINLYKKEKK